MQDIGLVMCPMWDADSPQLGLPLLKAYLQARGHRAFTLDFAIRLYNECDEGDRAALRGEDGPALTERGFIAKLFDRHRTLVERTIEELLDSGAKLFGFSLYFCTLESVVEFARRLKERAPDRLVVYGGPECARFAAGHFRPAELRRWLDPADAWVPGEGETGLARLLERRQDGRLRSAPGVHVKLGGGFHWGGEAPPLADLDSLPFADFSDYDLNRYGRPDRLVTYMTRGCIRKCTFCDVEFYWGRYRSRSGRRVFEDISRQLQANPGVRHFWFCDSIVNADMRRLDDFCDRMIAARRAGGPEIRWEAYAIVRADMTSAFVRKLAAAGCEQLHIGIESGSQRVLDRMKKGFRLRTAEEVLRRLFEAGIKTTMLLMVGFPGETEEDFEATLGFLRRAGPHASCISPSESLTYLGTGTPLRRDATTYGLDAGAMHSDYWRTLDGTNDYPVRLRRFQRLCEEADRLGLRLAPRLSKPALAITRMGRKYKRYMDGLPRPPRSLARRLFDAVSDPPGAARHYRERLIRAWRDYLRARNGSGSF